MNKLRCWWTAIASLLFGISDRTINSIIQNYSIESVSQILLALLLLALVYQLYPYNLGD